MLGITETALKKAMKQGEEYFAEYTKARCGTAYRAIDVSKPRAKIPRWKFEEIDQKKPLEAGGNDFELFVLVTPPDS